MAQTIKIWVGLGLAGLAANAQALPTSFHPAPLSQGLFQLAAAGEAGESGGVAVANDQPQYLAALAEVEGYAHAAALAAEGGLGMAAVKDFQTAALPALSYLGLAAKVRKQQPLAAVVAAFELGINTKPPQDAFATLQGELTKARGQGESVSAHAVVAGTVLALQQAAKVYGDGGDPAKRQQAWGITWAAAKLLKDLSSAERDEHKDVLPEIDGDMAKLTEIWPATTKTVAPLPDAHLLAAVAARIELASQQIK